MTIVIENIPLEILVPAKRNANVHTKAQINKIATSITRWGFTNPVLIGENNEIIGGHGRVEAARLLGMTTVPCVRLAGMSPEDKRAYAIADNQLARECGFDIGVLALELADLGALGFDLTLTAFDQPSIDQILLDADRSSPKPRPGRSSEVPELPKAAVTCPGDIWQVERHRLFCGDAADEIGMTALMQGRRADMMFADPSYNVPINGHASGLGKIRHREFSQAHGELTPQEFTAWLERTLAPSVLACRDGAIAYTCMDWRHVGELSAAGSAVFSELKNICVWDKGVPGLGAFYRSQHELVFVWKVGQADHCNNFGLGKAGRSRGNVWKYPGMNSFTPGRMEELARHPTPKPVALVEDAIRDVSNRGQLVLDPFGGAGTTLIAAERCGRLARLVEIDPGYCDVTVERFRQLTGKAAILEATGQTFEDVAAERAQPAPGAWSSNV